MLKKVFNWSEFHLSEVTSYKIHTLVGILKIISISDGYARYGPYDYLEHKSMRILENM